MLSYLSSYLWSTEDTTAVEDSGSNDTHMTEEELEVCNQTINSANELSWVLVDRDGANSPDAEILVDSRGPICSCSAAQEGQLPGSTSPNQEGLSSDAGLHDSEHPNTEIQTSNPAGISLETSFVENCLLELSVSHSEDVKDYLEQSSKFDDNVYSLVVNKKKPSKRKQPQRPVSIRTAIGVHLNNAENQSGKLDQKAKSRSASNSKAMSKRNMKRRNDLQRACLSTSKDKPNRVLARTKVMNQCAPRGSCH